MTTAKRPARTSDDDLRAFLTHPRTSRAERRSAGRAKRDLVPIEAHAQLPVIEHRRNPMELLRTQEAVREPALLPLRYERMSANPFAFLRGAAVIMASDLSMLPNSGIQSQLCGDAHVANFGMFASAERSLVFDLNDFDETLPGPFEWDLKRLAASVAVAAQANGLNDKDAKRAARTTARTYAETMANLSNMRTLDVWNAKLDVAALVKDLSGNALQKATVKAGEKSRKATTDTALVKLTEVVDGARRFRHLPPLLIPIPGDERSAVIEQLSRMYAEYLRTLPADRISLLTRFQFIDIAHKVVGVGSVGTRALVLLLESGDGEPLLLQAKQANDSVLEPYLEASQFANHGQRVVIGQRVMQATGDPFLGWAKGSARTMGDFYIRQLKDMKGSIDIALLDAAALSSYAQLTGAVLARAHARSGDAATISGYLGSGKAFADSIGEFALGYAKINTADYSSLVASR